MTGTATILSFPRARPVDHGLSVPERIATLRWADAVRRFGVRAVHIHDPEPGDAPGLRGFLLIYRDDALWASWGVAAAGGRYEVWRPASGATVGWFPTLGEALEVVQTVAGPRH
jgi:hypothetical protein